MKARRLMLGLLLLGTLTGGRPALAHHYWRGFDKQNRVTIKGIVTQFDWANPHISIALEVKDANGAVETWTAGGPSPSRLARQGWDKDTLKPGDEITLTGPHGPGDSHEIRLEKITLSDGREFAGYGNR